MWNYGIAVRRQRKLRVNMSSKGVRARIACLIFASIWTVVLCEESAVDAGSDVDGSQASSFKRAVFSAWAGKRSSDKSAYLSDAEKRAAFSSWAGKRDAWQEKQTDVGDVGDVYDFVEANAKQGDVSPGEKRASFSSWAGKRGPFSSWAGKRGPFSSWAGKRAGFSAWAGKRSSGLHNQLQLINELLEKLVSRAIKKRMFSAWAGKRDQQNNDDHDVTRRKFSAWSGK